MRLTVFIECSVPSPSWTSPDIRLYEELFSYTNIQQYLLANFQFEIKYSGGDAADQRHLNHTAAYTFPIQSTSELILARINVQTCWLNCQRPYPRNESLRTHILKLANQRPCLILARHGWMYGWTDLIGIVNAWSYLICSLLYTWSRSEYHLIPTASRQNTMHDLD